MTPQAWSFAALMLIWAAQAGWWHRVAIRARRSRDVVGTRAYHQGVQAGRWAEIAERESVLSTAATTPEQLAKFKEGMARINRTGQNYLIQGQSEAGRETAARALLRAKFADAYDEATGGVTDDRP